MKITLLDRNKKMTNIWKLYFQDCADVEVVCDDFAHFMDNNEIDCVVSPANSYGLMDGGYDLAISEWFGWDLQEKVQKYIIENFKGEQPVTTSFCIDTGVNNYKLIHTPTMRIPSDIDDPMIVYHCMRNTLICAISNNIDRIVIPAFGGACGGLKEQVIASMMYRGYHQIMNPPEEISWKYATGWKPEEDRKWM